MATKRQRWFYVARYTEEDAHSRDYGKAKVCLCSSTGYSRRGLHLRSWFSVRASSAVEAKALVEAGKGQRHS